MKKLEQKRFEKQNKDMLDTMRLLESKINELAKRIGGYSPEENYIERICDNGAIDALRKEYKTYERLVSVMTNQDNNRNLAQELFDRK